ncbi:hypothetical protein FRC10_002140 [Ceratobasidium sp. 414]|nr:hypothetical protein FRC10_002140 [Ceratobasidium sp. 414]
MDDLVLRPARGPHHWPKAATSTVTSQSSCLIVSQFDKKIHVWDCIARTEACKPLGSGSDDAYPVALSPDGRYLLSSHANTIQLWDTRTGVPVGNPLYCPSGFDTVAFSPRNHRIISASFDRTLRIWSKGYDGAHYKPRESFPQISSVALSPNGDRIISGHRTFSLAKDCIFRLWDAHTGALILAPALDYYGTACCVAFSPDGRHIASGLANGKVIICDSETGAILHTLEGSIDEMLWVGFSVDGPLVYLCSRKSLRAWDLRTGTAVRDVRVWSSDVRCAALSPNGRLLAFSSGDRIEVKNIETNTPSPTLHGHWKDIQCLAFSFDNRHIASGSMDQTVRLWDVGTGTTIVKPLRAHSGAVISVSFSRDGRLVVSGSEDCAIRIWDSTTGALLYKQLQGHQNPVKSVTFSSDGYRIISYDAHYAIGGNIRVWDLDTLSRVPEPSSLHAFAAEPVPQAANYGVRIPSSALER